MVPTVWLNPRLTNQIYRFRQIVDQGSVNQSTSAVVLGGFGARLALLDQAATFAAMFDFYRIAFVKFKFRPIYTAQYAASNAPPILYTAIDYDSIAAPASLAAIRQYSTCKETRYDKDHVRCFKPKIALGVVDTTGVVGAVSTTGWCDTADTNVFHYGLKYAITQGQVINFTYSVELEFFIEFKNLV
jgi:hypothetical protein